MAVGCSLPWRVRLHQMRSSVPLSSQILAKTLGTRAPGKTLGPTLEPWQGLGWAQKVEGRAGGSWKPATPAFALRGHWRQGQSSLIEHQLHASPLAPCSPMPPLSLCGAAMGCGQGRRGTPAEALSRASPAFPCSVDTDENRYPQKLAFAECLCQGCINTRTGRETAALSSVLLHQSLLVLRRQPCSSDATGVPTPGAFAFHVESIRVPIGCTCVLPRVVQ